MHRFTTLTALALLALPATAQAHPAGHGQDQRDASQGCRAERQADTEAFRARYANDNGRRAFRRCVLAHSREARETCRTERQNDPAAFRATYGNERGRRAFRRCVIAKGGHPRHHHRAPGIGAAAQSCRTERDADRAAFRAKYANDNGRRALRRCVLAHLRQARETCRTERQNDPAAFRATYGNERGRHAFRRCVRAHAGDPVA